MGRPIDDLSGKRFGKLTVIRHYGYSKSGKRDTTWLCQCDCGNEVVRTRQTLKDSSTNSCCDSCKHPYKDLTGQIFGKLTVIERRGSTNSSHKVAVWLCRCDCGNMVLRTSTHLNQINYSSCGKCRLIKDEDFIGKSFGYWTVISSLENKSNKKSFLCRCRCGKERVVNANTLKLGTSKSCGCYHMDEMKERQTTHGQTGTRIFNIYCNIKQRCYNENNKRFHDYGGRGIRMCEEWSNSFQSFYEWSIENGYSEELTIDRKDVNGNYEPQNCRWATMIEQANNKRTNINFTFFGVTKNLKEWCNCIGENYNKMYSRYSKGCETFRKEDIEKIKKYLEDGD